MLSIAQEFRQRKSQSTKDGSVNPKDERKMRWVSGPTGRGYVEGTPVLVVQEKRYWGQRKAGPRRGNSQIWGGPNGDDEEEALGRSFASSVSAFCLPLRFPPPLSSFFFSLVSHQPTFFFYQFYLIVDIMVESGEIQASSFD